MGVLSSAVNQSLTTITVNSSADGWTIEAGKEKQLTGQKIEFRPGNKKVGFVNTAAWLNWTDLLNISMVIDELSYARTTYDNIDRQSAFRKLYQLDIRSLQYINGTALNTQMQDSAPCQNCGLLLPLTHLTIDHVRPQTGGEVEAVAKMLRVLNLTVAGPSGQKNQALQAAVGQALSHPQGVGPGMMVVQMFTNFAPVPTKPGRGPKTPPGSSAADRYSLKWEGQVVYSAVKALGALPELKVRSMHSLVNLRPLCGSCNAARGNPLKF